MFWMVDRGCDSGFVKCIGSFCEEFYIIVSFDWGRFFGLLDYIKVGF